MKGTIISLSILLICVIPGTVFAQKRDQRESQVKLQEPVVQRLHTKIAQQQSQISELKRQLAERDTELHSLLKLISNQSNQPGQSDAQPSPNSSNKNDDEEDDSDDPCEGPLFAKGGSVPHNSGKVAAPHRGHLRQNPRSHDKVITHNSITGVPEM